MSLRLDLLLPNLQSMTDIVRAEHMYLLENWLDTLFVSAIAAFSSLFFALILSAFAIRAPVVERLVAPVVAVSQSFPLQAIAPLLVIVLGRGYLTKGFIAFLIAFFPLFVIVINSLRSVPRSLMLRCTTARAPFWRSFSLILLPAAAPAIVGGIKVAFTLAVLGAVVAEFVAPTGGIGMLLLRAQSNYNVERIYLCIIMLAAQGLAVFMAVSAIETRIQKRWS